MGGGGALLKTEEAHHHHHHHIITIVINISAVFVFIIVLDERCRHPWPSR